MGLRCLPNRNFQYSGLTVILDKPSRHDRTELCSGIAGAYFDSSLVAGGNPAVHRNTIEIRTIQDLHLPYLDGTRCLLLMGEDTVEFFKKDITLNEQRGAPFKWNGMNCIATYAPQDADDRRDFFSGDDSDDDEDDRESEGDKTTHGKTQRKNWRFWMRQDIKKAVRLTKLDLDSVIPQPCYHYWPDSKTIISLLTETKGKDFYFDIETDKHLQMTCFGFSVDEGKNIYVVPMLQTYTIPRKYYYDDTHLILRALTICLRDNTVVIHNSSFDLFVLAWRYGMPLCGKVFDTMLAHNRCYIEVEKSLGHVLSFYTYLPYHKNEGIFEPHNYVQTQQLYEYNGKDVFGLTQIKPEILAHAQRLGALESVEQVNRMVMPYLTMTLHGIKLNQDKMKEIVDYHERYNFQIKRVLSIITGYPDFNPNSWQQVSKYLYEDLRLPKPDKDPTNEKTLLQLLLKRDVPAIYGVLKYRGNQKRISKASVKSKNKPPRYYFGLYNKEGTIPRITCDWKKGKTVTMRLGSAKLLRRWGDNLQNWEKLLRKCISPDEGKCFLQIDQSGAEALICSYLCRAGAMRDLFLCGINPHVFLALHLFRLEFESVLKRSLLSYVNAQVKELSGLPDWKEIAKTIKSSDDWEPSRRYYFIAKQGNHSLNYDAKARAFRLNTLLKSEGAVTLTIDDSQKVIDKRLQLFPELTHWQSEVIQTAKKTNILRNLFGHPRVVTQRIEESNYKELYAFVPQSTVGQITNYAITEMQERIEANDDILVESGCDIMQNNHDSMLVQCWNDPKYYIPVANEMRKHFNRRLKNFRGEEFYMKSEVQYGMNWGEMKVLEDA